MKKNQQGFGVLGIIAVTVMVGLIGVTGWFVLNKKKGESSLNTNSQSQEKTEAELNAERDAERKSDINKIHDMLGGFFAQKVFYPTLSEISSDTWIAENTKGLDILVATPDEMIDPEDRRLGTSGSDYTYIPGPSGCLSGGECKEYILYAKLSDGSVYQKVNLN